jgi:hypothetical protein
MASEMKALVGMCPDVAQFPPGHFISSDGEEPIRYQPTSSAPRGRLGAHAGAVDGKCAVLRR